MLNEAETVTMFLNEQTQAKARGLVLEAVAGDSSYTFTIGKPFPPQDTFQGETDWCFRLSFSTLDEVSAFIEGWMRAGGG